MSELLRIERLTAGYGEAVVLSDLSLSVAEGQSVALLGRNGMGKTTLVNSIVGVTRYIGGAIMLDGKDIARLRPDARARLGIAIVPQGREIFPLLTVRENLETGFALLPRGERKVPEAVFELFPVLAEMMGRRGGDLAAADQPRDGHLRS